jgi:uncharacterized protein YbjT (DUF2867 family)
MVLGSFGFPRSSMRRVVIEVLLVVGGRGELGGRVARLLLEEGNDVRCLVRAGSDARAPSIRDADELGMASLVDTAESAGVRRFVYISFAGADAALGTPLERAKLATEQRLSRSSVRTVVVRPDAFPEIHLAPLGRLDMAAGKVAVFGKGDARRRWVSIDDVAPLVAMLAAEPDPPP